MHATAYGRARALGLASRPCYAPWLHWAPSGYTIGACPRPPAGGIPFGVPANGVGWRGRLSPRPSPAPAGVAYVLSTSDGEFPARESGPSPLAAGGPTSVRSHREAPNSPLGDVTAKRLTFVSFTRLGDICLIPPANNLHLSNMCPLATGLVADEITIPTAPSPSTPAPGRPLTFHFHERPTPPHAARRVHPPHQHPLSRLPARRMSRSSHSTRACGGLRFGGFRCRSLRAHSALACGSLRFGRLWRHWLPATSLPHSSHSACIRHTSIPLPSHPLGGCLGHSHSTRACGGLRFGGFWCRSLRAHSALACGSLRFGGLWRRWLPATSFPPFQPFARALTVIVVSNPPPQHPACEADHSGHLSRPFPSAPPPQPTCPFHTCRPPTTPSANSTPHQPCGEGFHLGGFRLGGPSVRGLAPHGSPRARTTRQLHPGHDSRTSGPLRRFHKWPISIRPHYKNQVYHFNVLQRHLRRTRSLALPLLTSFINSMRAHSPHSTPNLLQPTHSHFASGRFGGPRLGGARFGGLRRQADKEDLEICD